MAYKKIRQEQADFLKQKENEKKLNEELIKDYQELRIHRECDKPFPL